MKQTYQTDRTESNNRQQNNVCSKTIKRKRMKERKSHMKVEWLTLHVQVICRWFPLKETFKLSSIAGSLGCHCRVFKVYESAFGKIGVNFFIKKIAIPSLAELLVA